jgi:hypothetical protein
MIAMTATVPPPISRNVTPIKMLVHRDRILR